MNIKAHEAFRPHDNLRRDSDRAAPPGQVSDPQGAPSV